MCENYTEKTNKFPLRKAICNNVEKYQTQGGRQYASTGWG